MHACWGFRVGSRAQGRPHGGEETILYPKSCQCIGLAAECARGDKEQQAGHCHRGAAGGDEQVGHGGGPDRGITPANPTGK